MPALFALLAALFAALRSPGFCPAPLLPSLVYLPVPLCCFPFHAAAAHNLLLLLSSPRPCNAAASKPSPRHRPVCLSLNSGVPAEPWDVVVSCCCKPFDS